MRAVSAKAREIEAQASDDAETRDAEAGQGHAEIGDLWLILKHRRGLIGLTALLMLLGTLAYCLLTPALYTATAQIFIDPRDKAVVSNDVNSGVVAPDGGVTQVESQSRVIESSGVLLRAIRAAGLATDPEFGLPGYLSALFAAAPAPDTSAVDGANAAEMRALRALKRKLAIKRADKVFIIDVTVTAQAASKAARIANAVTDAYLADQAEARSQGARRASDSLVARLAEQRQKVNDAEVKVARYKADNNLIASNGLLIGEAQISELNNQIVSARSKTAELRARIDQIDRLRRGGGKADATAEAISSTVVSQLRQREAELVQREADLRTQFGPRHPSMAAVQAQIRDVHQLVVVELERIGRSARADYERARASEASLTRSLETLKTGSATSQQASVKLRELERDLEAARSVYASFLLRSQETREQAGIDSPNARVITRALPPDEKSWPLTPFLLLGALGGGLGLGAGLGLAGEYAAPTLLSRGQMQRTTGLPVASMALPGKGGTDQAAAAAGQALGQLLRARPADPQRPAARPQARSILLLASGAPTQCGRQVALLLARALQMKGARVLVADAQAGRGPFRPGLHEVLRGEQALEPLVANDASGVPVLEAGAFQVQPANPSGIPKLSRLTAQAAGKFDLVIIHGGAVEGNPSIAALIGAADETFLVAQEGKTRQRAATQTLELLRNMGAEIPAAVLAHAA